MLLTPLSAQSAVEGVHPRAELMASVMLDNARHCDTQVLLNAGFSQNEIVLYADTAKELARGLFVRDDTSPTDELKANFRVFAASHLRSTVGSSVQAGALYGHYEQWCEKNDCNVATQRAFGDLMRAHGYKVSRGRIYTYLDTAFVGTPSNDTSPPYGRAERIRQASREILDLCPTSARIIARLTSRGFARAEAEDVLDEALAIAANTFAAGDAGH